uniref:Uncharacterized protein n=1 Tax=Arundo donax TaxID=35708 RepID=A0A0A9FY06_ARUDO
MYSTLLVFTTVRIAPRGAAYIPIVSAAHSSPTANSRAPPCNATSTTTTTVARKPTFTASTSFAILALVSLGA